MFIVCKCDLTDGFPQFRYNLVTFFWVKCSSCCCFSILYKYQNVLQNNAQNIVQNIVQKGSKRSKHDREHRVHPQRTLPVVWLYTICARWCFGACFLVVYIAGDSIWLTKQSWIVFNEFGKIMSEKAVSTAVSDLVLAGCSLYAAVHVHGTSVYAAWGFLCVSIAASFGVLKFGVAFPNVQSKVIRLHALFTWIASTVGRTGKAYYSPPLPPQKK